MKNKQLASELKCPYCGYTSIEKIPKDACQYFFQCQNCHEVIKAKPGDCCVFCSYGSEPCPYVSA